MDNLLNMPLDQFLQQSFVVILVCMAAALAAGVALLVVAARQIRDLEIPEDADFFETLLAVPITVPIALDLLDMGLDVLAAPVSWVILEMLGLGALKMITTIEALIPGTQVIPTMTLAWVLARFMKKDRNTPFRQAMRDQQMLTRGQYPQVSRTGRSRADQIRRMALPPGSRAGAAGGRALADGDVIGDAPGGIRPSRRRRSSPDDDFLEGEYDDLEAPRSRRDSDVDYDGDGFPDEDADWG